MVFWSVLALQVLVELAHFRGQCAECCYDNIVGAKRLVAILRVVVLENVKSVSWLQFPSYLILPLVENTQWCYYQGRLGLETRY